MKHEESMLSVLHLLLVGTMFNTHLAFSPYSGSLQPCLVLSVSRSVLDGWLLNTPGPEVLISLAHVTIGKVAFLP